MTTLGASASPRRRAADAWTAARHAQALRSFGLALTGAALFAAAFGRVLGPATTASAASPDADPLFLLGLLCGLVGALNQHLLQRVTRAETACWVAALGFAALAVWFDDLRGLATGTGSCHVSAWTSATGLALAAVGQIVRPRSADLALALSFAGLGPALVALIGHLMGSRDFHGEMDLASAVGLAGLCLACIARSVRQPLIRLVLSPSPIGRLIRLQMAAWLAFHVGLLLTLRQLHPETEAYHPLLHSMELLAAWTLVAFYGAKFADMHRTAERTERHLKGMAGRDALTRVATRRAARDFVDALPARTRLGVLIADLDHFKDLNDRYGHAAGDIALKAVADTLREGVRSSDLVVRWGGEEFVILLRNVTATGAAQVAETMRQAVSDMSLGAAEGRCVTVSIGVTLAQLPAAGGLEALIAHADRALYAAKSHGRNRVFLIDPEAPGGPRAVSSAPAFVTAD